MIIQIPQSSYKDIIFIDTEFDNNRLVQIAMIHFKAIAPDHYQLQQSFNYYIQIDNLSPFFTKYTHITQEYLNQYGITLSTLKYKLKYFFSTLEQPLFVGHNLKSDCVVLRRTGIELIGDKYCTYKHAIKYYDIEKGFDVATLAATAGFYLNPNHDAYYDALALIPIFTQLRIIESDNSFYFTKT